MEENQESKKQYDAALGGGQNLPNDINIFKFAAARAKEMEYMEHTIKHPSNTKLVFQKLPIHMRRRVMSHNAKRLPRRLREIHLNQLRKSTTTGEGPQQQKRPSRRYRRRPANLQSEYIRRQRRIRWLETHIWHAKRFHMIERWGYKIPDRPCDKSYRALYRASAKYCLLQDVSYYNCIEIHGSYQIVIDGLKQISTTETGLGFWAACYTKGTREGSSMLYNPNSYPYKAIGEVKFMWKPTSPAENKRTLWIWCHPSFSSKIFDILKEIFSSSEITINNLCYDLNRFRLTGPLSLPILKKALITSNINNIPDGNWVKPVFDKFNAQNEYWNDIVSSENLDSKSILGIIATDPRFNMPAKRTNLRGYSDADYELPPFLLNDQLNCTKPNNLSPIWDKEIRENCLADKLSNADICKLKSDQLVPGYANWVPSKLACLPVIIIQRPGSDPEYLGYGSGFDVIIPTSWGLPLWRTLVMWGARVGGLREERVQILESQRGNYLQYPDTDYGQAEMNRIHTSLLDKYFKLPTNKRVNYIKNGIVTPFYCDWKLLASEWCPVPNDAGFYVLRNKKNLKDLQIALATNVRPSNLNTFEMQQVLIPVKLKLLTRGSIKDLAIICLPAKPDSIKNEPTEDIKEDINQLKRKELRSQHSKLLKKLKRGRARLRKEAKNDDSDLSLKSMDSNAIKLKYSIELRSLYFPKPESIRNSCSRNVIGYVTNGDYSFIGAKCCAVGYITLQSLFLVQNQYVLVRDRNSRQYRSAILNVII